MSNNTQTRISFRKGLSTNLPVHAPVGEPLFCLDTKELYVGMGDCLPLAKINISLDDLFENPEDLQYLKYVASLYELLGERGEKLRKFMTSMEAFKTDIEGFKTTVQAFMNSKGKANGIAPLDAEGKVPKIHLPQINIPSEPDKEPSVPNVPNVNLDIIYKSDKLTTQQQLFVLHNIDFTKYKKIEIKYKQPHTCANTFYVNDTALFCPRSPVHEEVCITLQDSVVSWVNGTQKGSDNFNPKTNGQLKWQYTNTCIAPQFSYISVIGYY